MKNELINENKTNSLIGQFNTEKKLKHSTTDSFRDLFRETRKGETKLPVLNISKDSDRGHNLIKTEIDLIMKKSKKIKYRKESNFTQLEKCIII